MIPVPTLLNYWVINPHHLSLVFQQSFISSNNTPCDNRWFTYMESHANINELFLPVIPVPPPLNDSVINLPQLSSVSQQTSSSSHNTSPESEASSIPGRNSSDPSNTTPLLSTHNLGCNIYGCMVDVSKLTPAQQQHNTVRLLQHYNKLCNTNYPSSMIVSTPSIASIESLSQFTISSLDSGLFGRNRYDVNIQQATT